MLSLSIISSSPPYGKGLRLKSSFSIVIHVGFWAMKKTSNFGYMLSVANLFTRTCHNLRHLYFLSYIIECQPLSCPTLMMIKEFSLTPLLVQLASMKPIFSNPNLKPQFVGLAAYGEGHPTFQVLVCLEIHVTQDCYL